MLADGGGILYAARNTAPRAAVAVGLPYDFARQRVDAPEGDDACVVLIHRPMERGADVDGAFARFFVDFKHRRTVGVIHHILHPNDFHGVDVDAEKVTRVVGNVHVVPPYDGARFKTQPVCPCTALTRTLGGVAPLKDVRGIYGNGSGRLVVQGVELELVDDTGFGGVGNGIRTRVHERCGVKRKEASERVWVACAIAVDLFAVDEAYDHVFGGAVGTCVARAHI